ncbi:MAG TPA: hypothetical protein VMT60_02655 [Candidatus Bathyarchaeia archaeon]|nr:hypothetical protein [Candidatus Bathyarchaeia archaeon]
MIKKEIRLPVYSIVLLSFGGWLAHVRVHPISFGPSDPTNPILFVPFFAGIVAIVAVPFLLNSARTFIAGYLINGMSVVVGTIGMAAFSLSRPPSPLTFHSVLTGTMLGSIVLSLPKLFLGQMVLYHYHPRGMGRLFTPFYWARHFVYLGAIFALGRFLWR